MKRIIAVIAAFALSVSLASCGSNNQANAIKAACDLALAKDFDGTRNAFMEIARNNPGYIDVAAGARLWAIYEGVNPELAPEMYGDSARGVSYNYLQSFFAICELNFNP